MTFIALVCFRLVDRKLRLVFHILRLSNISHKLLNSISCMVGDSRSRRWWEFSYIYTDILKVLTLNQFGIKVW
jgi:hypothetical protein